MSATAPRVLTMMTTQTTTVATPQQQQLMHMYGGTEASNGKLLLVAGCVVMGASALFRRALARTSASCPLAGKHTHPTTGQLENARLPAHRHAARKLATRTHALPRFRADESRRCRRRAAQACVASSKPWILQSSLIGLLWPTSRL